MRPGAFTQLYIHLIFAVKYRDRLLRKDIRNIVLKYISGIISERKHKSIIVNGIDDHIHILVGLNPAEGISELIRHIKRSSSLFINKEKLCKGTFHWQEGYGAFSCSRSQLDKVYKYIANQESHHKMNTFQEEYKMFLKNFEIKYEDKYLFDFFE
jgi:REP-associated tyrosine transposase